LYGAGASRAVEGVQLRAQSFHRVARKVLAPTISLVVNEDLVAAEKGPMNRRPGRARRRVAAGQQ